MKSQTFTPRHTTLHTLPLGGRGCAEPSSANPRCSPTPAHHRFALHHKTVIQLSIVLFLTTATLHARVFTRWGGHSDAIGSLTRLGGKIAYSSNVKINNGQGKLTVIGFDDGLQNTAPQIKRLLNIPSSSLMNHQASTINRPASTSLHILHGKTTTLRLILLQLPQTARLIAIAIEQPNEEYQKSQNPPATHQLKTIPPYPGSTPTFYAESSETKLRIALSSSADNIESIRAFYNSSLKSAGWQPYLSDAFGSIPQIIIYQRDNELCYILVTPTEKNSTITLIYKQLSL